MGKEEGRKRLSGGLPFSEGISGSRGGSSVGPVPWAVSTGLLPEWSQLWGTASLPEAL